MLSYWEQSVFSERDVVIVGGGLVGLWTAMTVKRKRPKLSVLVLDRHVVPTGASTKNAGFACVGSVTELSADIDSMGPEATHRLVALRADGLRLLSRRLPSDAIELHWEGGYELIGPDDAQRALERMNFLNTLCDDIFPKSMFQDATHSLDALGFSKAHVRLLLSNRYEGGLHSGKLLGALRAKNHELGVDIWSGAAVQKLYPQESSTRVEVHAGSGALSIKAQHVALCTNAYATELWPELEIQPGRGQVLLTGELPPLPFRGVFHADAGYYYFRPIGNRILMGGGRHLDTKTEATKEMGLNPSIQAALERYLADVILPHHQGPIPIEQRWSGIMGLGPTRWPLVQRLTNNLIAGVRLGGMGVALGPKVGEILAEAMLNPERSLAPLEQTPVDGRN